MSTLITILVTALVAFPIGYMFARNKYWGRPVKLEDLPRTHYHIKQITESDGKYYLVHGENPAGHHPLIVEKIDGYLEEGWYQIGMQEGRAQVRSTTVKS